MLARALVADPAVLVVDEPLDGLDPRHAQEATTRLHALATDQGKLVIAAVHDLTLALRRASRIWALRDGRLLGDGPAHEVLTPDLLERLFDVRADIVGVGARAYVDISDAR
jgi:iron complex transport system ATP-binding protein